MRSFLLDTCAFLWLDSAQGGRFGRAAMEILRGDHEMVLSDVSVWEMCIKVSVGKLSLPNPVESLIEGHVSSGMRILPIRQSHILLTERLPIHHRDPFDRLLVAQSMAENLPLLSADPLLDLYGIERIWD